MGRGILTYEEAVRAGRKAGIIGEENYHLYFNKKDGSCSVCREEVAHKREDCYGYYVEDDSRLPGIYQCYLRASKRR